MYKNRVYGEDYRAQKRAGDGDGVVVIKPEDAPELLEKTLAVSAKEAQIMETMLRDGTYLRPWVDEKLREIGCDF